MKLSLLSLAALSLVLTALTSTASASEGLPIPYPEQGLFGPIGSAHSATSAPSPNSVASSSSTRTSTAASSSSTAPAFAPAAKGHPAWDVKVSVESKGLPLRAVIAAVFEIAKVPYAVDPALDHTIYASVKDVTLRDAIGILNRLAPFEVRAENNVWYATLRKPKAKVEPTPEETIALAGPISPQTVLVDATPRNETVPMRVTPPASLPVKRLPEPQTPLVRTPWASTPVTKSTVTKSGVTKTATAKTSTTKSASAKTPATKTATAKGNPVPVKSNRPVPPGAKPQMTKPIIEVETTAKPALNRRVNTKLPKTDLREVFETFSQQTGVAIIVDESVPRYKIDSYMKGCSLKYALDRICEATGLKYEAHGAAIRIVKPS